MNRVAIPGTERHLDRQLRSWDPTGVLLRSFEVYAVYAEGARARIGVHELLGEVERYACLHGVGAVITKLK